MSLRFSFYAPGDSWLHRLDPRTKLWAVLLAGILGLVFKHLAVLGALLVFAHLILLSARVSWDRMRWLWVRLGPLLIMIMILQPLFAPGPGPDLLRLGPVRITVVGLLDGLSFALRAASLTFLAALLLLTTDPNALVQGLVKLGLPYTWGLTVGLAIRYLPTTYGLFVTVQEAQQARGWVAGHGGFLQRIRSYLPILVATIIGALRLSDNLGLALAARGLGYPAQRTTLYDLRFGALDRLAVGLVTLLFVGLLVGRYLWGFGGRPWG
jgi:energy-coupling factor transport system permease protein